MNLFHLLWKGLISDNPVAGLIGMLGLTAAVILYQQKDNKRLLVWKIISESFWLAHYLLLKNYSVVVVDFVAVVRSIVLLNSEKRWAQSPAWLWIFLGISLGFGIAAWKDWTSLLVIMSGLIAVAIYWSKSPKVTRYGSIPAATLHLINVIIHFTLWGTINDLLTITSSIVGIIRLDLPVKRKLDPEMKETQSEQIGDEC